MYTMRPDKWLLVQHVILLCVLYHCPCQPMVNNRMTRPAQCAGQVISVAYRYRTLAVRSSLECAGHCRPADPCLSVVFDLDNRLCHLGNATMEDDCSNMEAAVGRMKYYEIVCKNGGQMDSQGKCACVDSYVGNRCERIMADCTEGVISGTVKKKGVYNIQPALAPSPFPVFCRTLEQLSRTRVLHREDPAVSFNRSWSEYRDGFGDLSGDHWLGLEKLHLLTASKSYGLRFLMKPPNCTASYSFYEDFVLSDEASGYSFTVGTLRSDKLANCLDGQQGVPFSAYDVDNDDNSTFNCASQYGGGWWFKGDNCSLCNPTGPILPPFDGMRKGVLGESFWGGFGDGYPFPITMFLVVE